MENQSFINSTKMKLVFSFNLTLLCAFLSYGQNAIPMQVQGAFSSQFPNATDVEWEIEENGFEAEFKSYDKHMAALYDMSGKWVETETEINRRKMPGFLKDAIAHSFKGYRIMEVEEVSKPDLEKGYEVELQSGKKSIEVLFDIEGQILKQEEEREDDKEDSKDGN